MEHGGYRRFNRGYRAGKSQRNRRNKLGNEDNFNTCKGNNSCSNFHEESHLSSFRRCNLLEQESIEKKYNRNRYYPGIHRHVRQQEFYECVDPVVPVDNSQRDCSDQESSLSSKSSRFKYCTNNSKHIKTFGENKSSKNIYHHRQNVCCESQNNELEYQNDSKQTRSYELGTDEYIKLIEFSQSKLPINLLSQNTDDKLNLIRKLKAAENSILQTFSPSEIVHKCRQHAVDLTEEHIENHQKSLEKISLQMARAKGNGKSILQNHFNNLREQQGVFEKYIQNILSKLTDIYQLSVEDTLSKTESIKCEIEKECKLFGKSLPAYAFREVIEMSVKQNQVTIIAVDPCYFANLLIPLFLQSVLHSDSLICCEPNIISAINASTNLSLLVGKTLGSFVGYETEENCQKDENTKILYTTIQKLFSYSLKDSKFLQFSCIIFDELLTRTVEADLLLAKFHDCLSTRDDLKIILLASNEEEIVKFKRYFSKSGSVSVIKTPNLLFPVHTIWKEALSSPNDNYIAELVETALSIHTIKDRGDILAFLPNSEEVSEASVILIHKFQEYHYYDTEIIQLNENTAGKKILQIMSTKEPLKRRIILATTCAEMLLFPTVQYVIDTGVMNQFHYNSDKNMDMLSVSFISKIKARRRKMCAGRFMAGTCYRLYNKYNYVKHMEEDYPEILTGDPLKIMVKILQYRPNDAMNAEFIDSISQTVKENSFFRLKQVGAVKDDKLTTLGQLMVKLPFNPRYSKLLVMGIQWGYPFEVMVLVAFFSTKGSIFKHENMVDKGAKTVDAIKLQFVQNDSDSLTYLNIYQQWKEHDYKESWCMDNSINIGFLEKVKKRVDEIASIVNKSLEENIIDEFQEINDSYWYIVQKVLFETFKDNLSVFTGHFLSGYKLITAHCIVFLHPSSSLCQKENLPKYVIFDHLHSMSRDFMVNVTSVPEKIITEAIQNGNLCLEHSELSQNQLVPVVIEPVGVKMIKQVILGKGGQKLNELEEMIKKETKSEMIVIEPSVEKGNVVLYTLPHCNSKAETLIRKLLESNLDSLWFEEETLTVELSKGKTAVSVNITWIKGARVTTANVNGSKNSHSKKRIKSLKENNALNSETSVQFSVNLSWIRRPCKGYGYVTFEQYNDFQQARLLATKTIIIQGAEAEILVNKKSPNQLYVRGLPPETTSADLKEAIKEKLPSSVEVSSVIVAYSKEFETTDNDCRGIVNKLKAEISHLIKAYEFEIEVDKPKNTATIMKARISMASSNEIEHAAEMLNGKLTIGNVYIKAEPVYCTTLFCSIEMLTALKQRFCSELEILEKELKNREEFKIQDDLFQFEADMFNHNTARLKLLSNNLKIMNILQRIVYDLLDGDVVDNEKIRGLHKLFTHGGHIWLKRLEKIEGIHIMDEYKSKTIRLYGSPESCESARRRILEFLDNAENEVVKVINLSEGNNTRTLLKAIIHEYGISLESFIEINELRSAEMNIRMCQLTLHGSMESIEKAEHSLGKLVGHCASSSENQFQTSKETCPVCMYQPLGLTYRLEYCGHLYCPDCIKGLVNEANFPITCCAEDCSKEVVLEDIHKVLDYEKEQIDRLLHKALKDFIEKNKPHVMYCPAPDCTMFFDKNVVGKKWTCPLCLNEICIECNAIFHRGYSCEMYQGTKQDSDYSVKVWMREDTKVRKRCPRCGTAVEKIDGCNHMTCACCQSHFCWLCLKAFPTGNQVYQHLPFCERNQTPY